MLSIKTYQPNTPQLTKFVQDFWMLEGYNRNDHDNVQRFFINGGIEFCFNIAMPVEFFTDHSPPKVLRNCHVIGTSSRAICIRPTGAVKFIGVRFRPGCSYPFVQIPANEFTDQAFDLSDVIGTAAHRLTEKICQPGLEVSRRFYVLETFLKELLDISWKYDFRLEAAIKVIVSTQGKISIHKLAKKLNISSRQLERIFKEKVGLSPKRICRKVRFQRVFDHLCKFPNDTWSSIALSCGFFDQSHFINEFQYFTGSSPSDFFVQAHQNDFLF